MLSALISFLLDEIGQLMRYLRQRAHDRHVRGVELAIGHLAKAQETAAAASRLDAHAHQHLAHATTSLTEAQTALIAEVALGSRSNEHLAHAIDRLAAAIERIADHLNAPRIVDALPPSRDLSQAPRRQAD